MRPEASSRTGGKADAEPDEDRAGRVAERATTIVEAVRPIVQRAMNDPELHAAMRQAFDTGREVTTEVRSKPPKKAARSASPATRSSSRGSRRRPPTCSRR